MRIATWNLEGKWTLRHRHLIESLDADLLLLTEVPDRVAIAGLRVHLTQGEMQPGRRWAAVAARTPISPLPDPHGATARADVDGLRVASSVLPWRNCGGSLPWTGPDQGSRTIAAVTDIEAANPVIWGGDWNHELAGRIYAGSIAGRTVCQERRASTTSPSPRSGRSPRRSASVPSWRGSCSRITTPMWSTSSSSSDCRHGPSFQTLMSLCAGRRTESGSQPCFTVWPLPV
ncbi:endonuclease/exonuclease/phosphatase family protein [Nocardioides cheoyonin]|uniref:endonuclease/exonuclease/phosphatase family protein n=1 Tax=Nocardioides cheoyonin TaxID=3156615 RepID=UPI003CCC8164